MLFLCDFSSLTIVLIAKDVKLNDYAGVSQILCMVALGTREAC